MNIHPRKEQVPPSQRRFNEAERRHLLSSPGLGPVVVQRLEEAGLASIAALRRQELVALMLAVSEPGTKVALRNRQRALRRALETYSH